MCKMLGMIEDVCKMLGIIEDVCKMLWVEDMCKMLGVIEDVYKMLGVICVCLHRPQHYLGLLSKQSGNLNMSGVMCMKSHFNQREMCVSGTFLLK